MRDNSCNSTVFSRNLSCAISCFCCAVSRVFRVARLDRCERTDFEDRMDRADCRGADRTDLASMLRREDFDEREEDARESRRNLGRDWA